MKKRKSHYEIIISTTLFNFFKKNLGREGGDVLLVVVGCLTRCNVEVGILEIMPMEVGISFFQNTCCHFSKKVVVSRSSLRLNTCT